MKILFTGSSSKQTSDDAHERARVKRIDDSSIICNSLRKQGFIVDRRNVEWGDDLSEYGLAIVGIGQFSSSTFSNRIFNAIYTVAKAKNVLLFHEDWKIDGTVRSFKGILEEKNWEKAMAKQWTGGIPFYPAVESPHFDAALAKQTIRDIVNGKYDCIIPAFDWGDKQIVRNILKSTNIYNLDLTPYVLKNWNIPLTIKTKPKEKKHMLASLVDHTAWVKRNKLNWQVDYYGAKSMNAPLLSSETEVFHKCGDYWSVLCPEYPHAGSGWFRVRWIYAAIWNSILLSGEKDLEALGLPKVNIEELNDQELEAYANQQSKTVLKHMWTIEDFDARLKCIVLGKEENLTISAPGEVSLESFFE
jgi:hypothetical protein